MFTNCIKTGTAGVKDATGRAKPTTSLQLVYSEKEMYTFFVDGVFVPESSQADIFSEIKPFVQSSIDGDNVCIFAYG